jgi:hypothetical protein
VVTCLYEKDSLYYGSDNGTLYRFKLEGEPEEYMDEGQSINAYWYSKLMDFGISEKFKNIGKVFYTMKPNDRTAIEIYKLDNHQLETLIHTNRMDIFNFKAIFFDYLSFLANNLPKARRVKAKIKKVDYMQIKVQNNGLNEGLEIMSLSFEVTPMSYVR